MNDGFVVKLKTVLSLILLDFLVVAELVEDGKGRFAVAIDSVTFLFPEVI